MKKKTDYPDEVNCGHCKWHRKDRNAGEFVCVCFGSTMCGEETDYTDVCTEYEPIPVHK